MLTSLTSYRKARIPLFILVGILVAIPVWGRMLPGKIKAFNTVGEVGVINEVTLERQPLYSQQVFEDKYTVVTDRDSAVSLLFSNGAIVMLGENARLLVQEFEQEPFTHVGNVQTKVQDSKNLPHYSGSKVLKSAELLEEDPSKSKTKLYLAYGELAAYVKPLYKGSLFQVNSPVLTMNARESKFTFSYKKVPFKSIFETRILAYEGPVYMNFGKGTEVLDPLNVEDIGGYLDDISRSRIVKMDRRPALKQELVHVEKAFAEMNGKYLNRVPSYAKEIQGIYAARAKDKANRVGKRRVKVNSGAGAGAGTIVQQFKHAEEVERKKALEDMTKGVGLGEKIKYKVDDSYSAKNGNEDAQGKEKKGMQEFDLLFDDTPLGSEDRSGMEEEDASMALPFSELPTVNLNARKEEEGVEDEGTEEGAELSEEDTDMTDEDEDVIVVEEEAEAEVVEEEHEMMSVEDTEILGDDDTNVVAGDETEEVEDVLEETPEKDAILSEESTEAIEEEGDVLAAEEEGVEEEIETVIAEGEEVEEGVDGVSSENEALVVEEIATLSEDPEEEAEIEEGDTVALDEDELVEEVEDSFEEEVAEEISVAIKEASEDVGDEDDLEEFVEQDDDDAFVMPFIGGFSMDTYEDSEEEEAFPGLDMVENEEDLPDFENIEEAEGQELNTEVAEALDAGLEQEQEQVFMETFEGDLKDLGEEEEVLAEAIVVEDLGDSLGDNEQRKVLLMAEPPEETRLSEEDTDLLEDDEEHEVESVAINEEEVVEGKEEVARVEESEQEVLLDEQEQEEKKEEDWLGGFFSQDDDWEFRGEYDPDLDLIGEALRGARLQESEEELERNRQAQLAQQAELKLLQGVEQVKTGIILSQDGGDEYDTLESL